MPYSSRTAGEYASRSSHELSSVMSLNRLTVLHVNMSKIHDSRSRMTHDSRFASANLFGPTQKNILINLNGRLAVYLEKVHMLEESNRRLEAQIKETLEKRAKTAHNSSQYETIIKELETQINEAKVANVELCLNIENTKLAADGFKSKYESELTLQRSIAADVKELKTTNSDLEMQKGYLETEVQILTHELQSLQRDHKEDLKGFQGKLACHVHVELNSMKASELSKALSKMREQYQVMAGHHQKNTEAWISNKSRESISQNTTHKDFLCSQRKEVFKLSQKLQELEIQMEVLHGMKFVQEDTLNETVSRYSTHLQNIQEAICKREEELTKIKAKGERLSSDSRILNYLKDLLEMEIKTYNILMDEEEIRMEDVIAEGSFGIPRAINHKQMYLFLISESSSVITK
ncbi:keratin, type I cytoskeletal 19-like [Pelodytes ibericus]